MCCQQNTLYQLPTNSFAIRSPKHGSKVPASRWFALGRDAYTDMQASLVARLAALDEQKLLALSTESGDEKT